MAGPAPNENGSTTQSASAAVNKNTKAQFFESAASAVGRDVTAENKAQIAKEYEEKKAIAALRKQHLEEERLAKEQKDKEATDSKARMAAKRAAFEGKSNINNISNVFVKFEIILDQAKHR